MQQQFGNFVSSSNEATDDSIDFNYRATRRQAFGLSLYMDEYNNNNNN